jgi:2-polyprenyl-6-methoxyphenol hydroxylase-like FAD-dependent oxidoreductase
VDRLAFYEGAERSAEVSFGALASPCPFLAILPQHDLEGLLAERLRERGVEVRFSHRVASLVPGADDVAVEVQRLGKASSGYAVAHTGWVVDGVATERPRFVVGADGHRSLVRRHLGLELEPAGEPSLYAVFEGGGAARPEGEVRVVLGEATADVLWPLPGQRFRWSFQLPDDERLRLWREKGRLAVSVGQQAYPHLGREAFDELLRERAPWFEATAALELHWSVLVRFERGLVPSFGRDRVWLAGDAAHLAGPLAVRSMNVGLREARDLAERIARVARGGGSPDLLRAYGAERLEEWRGLLDLERQTGRGARLRACLPASGTDLETLARSSGLPA